MNDKSKHEAQPTTTTAVSSAVTPLRSLLQEMMQKTVQLSQATLALYAQGEVAHTALAPLCEELLAMEQSLLMQPEPPIADPLPLPPAKTAVAAPTEPAPPPPLTHCPQCHTAVAPGKKFCTNCGLRLIPPEPSSAATIPTPKVTTSAETPYSAPYIAPPPASIAPTSTPGTLAAHPAGNCPTCGVELIPNAAFCTNCGQPLAASGHPPVPPPATQAPYAAPTVPHPFFPAAPLPTIAKYCQNCGKGVSAEVMVCTECGGRMFDPV